MLSKEQTDAFAVMLGIEADVLAQAVSDEKEVKLELPKGRFLTSEKEEELLSNHGKRRYDSGIEKATKDAFDSKSKEDFIKEITDAALEEAKVEPNKKVIELEKSISNLQKIVVEKEDAFSNLQQAMQQKESRINLQSLFPSLPENVGLNTDEATSLFLMSHEVKEDGVYKAGVLLKGAHEEALTKEQAVKNFITDKGWDKKPSGRGGGAQSAAGGVGKIETMEQFESMLKEKGLTVGSMEANALMNEVAKESPEAFS